MQIRKSATALGAALAIMGLSTSASAFECEKPAELANTMTELSVAIRCEDSDALNPGKWPADNPLWERRMGESCEDHASTAGAFLEFSEPKGKNPQDKPAKQTGIVVALLQENYEEALRDLHGVLKDVSGDDLNRAYEPNVAEAHAYVQQLKTQIEQMIICVEQLIED